MRNDHNEAVRRPIKTNLPPPKYFLSAAPLTNGSPILGAPTKPKQVSNNPSSVRSREKYQRDLKSLDGPFSLWLSDSEVSEIILLMGVKHPQLRDTPRDDANFRKEFAKALRPFVQFGLREIRRAKKLPNG